MLDGRRMRHQPLAILAQRDDRQLEVDPPWVLRDELMNLRYMDEADRKKLDALVRVLQKVLDPLHRLGMEKEVSPFHELVAAQAPELFGIRRLPADVLEDKLPILVGRLGGIERLAVRMIELVAEFAFHRAIAPEADRDLARVHLTRQHIAIIFF